MKVVIVLPTYNEKGNIQKLIPYLEEKVFAKIKNHQMNILVVDDNSPDGTSEEVKKLMKRYKNLKLNQGVKRGLGAAYMRGMNHAISEMNAKVLFMMDSDFFHDPNKIPDFLKKIDQGYDMVIGTRYSGGGSIPHNWQIHRKFLSVFGNAFLRIVLFRFYVHDWTGGFRAVKKDVFLKEKDKLKKYNGYTYLVAFLYEAIQDGYKIAEVPFVASDRTYGHSKFTSASYMLKLLQYILGARLKEVSGKINNQAAGERFSLSENNI